MKISKIHNTISFCMYMHVQLHICTCHYISLDIQIFSCGKYFLSFYKNYRDYFHYICLSLFMFFILYIYYRIKRKERTLVIYPMSLTHLQRWTLFQAKAKEYPQVQTRFPYMQNWNSFLSSQYLGEKNSIFSLQSNNKTWRSVWPYLKRKIQFIFKLSCQSFLSIFTIQFILFIATSPRFIKQDLGHICTLQSFIPGYKILSLAKPA